MRAGIGEARLRGDNLGSSEATTRVMAQAPVTVFVLKPGGMPPWITRSIERAFQDVDDNQLVAAVSLGYPAESPGPRPRKPAGEVVRWMKAGAQAAE